MIVDTTRKLAAMRDLAPDLESLFPGTVFVEIESKNRVVLNRVDSVIASEESRYQRIDIFDTPHYGRCLALDGVIQVARSDEFVYHELLIHPACSLLPHVRSALILGGGDGCAGRELLKYDELENLDMVELDRDVIRMCAAYFEPVNQGALKDPRMNVVVSEGEEYLKKNPDKRYDLIVADLTEPYETPGAAGELSRHIFSTEFYAFLKSRLTPDGVMSVQTGGLTYVPELDRRHKTILRNLRRSFRTVETAYAYVHSFDEVWSVTLASDHPYHVIEFDPDPILARRGISGLRHYGRLAHRGAFYRPRHIWEDLD